VLHFELETAKSKKQVCVLCELCGVSMAEFSGIIETPL
jgi:hypothetical protein